MNLKLSGNVCILAHSRTLNLRYKCSYPFAKILCEEDIPDKVAINEAVELAKGYDEAETVSFVNGVLGGFMRGEFGEEEKE